MTNHEKAIAESLKRLADEQCESIKKMFADKDFDAEIARIRAEVRAEYRARNAGLRAVCACLGIADPFAE